MTEVTLNGVSVKFPFKPYKVQEDYMRKVIECLQNGQHGVLESPTGTGKTLSLLCSTLSWLTVKKAQMQATRAFQGISENSSQSMKSLKQQLDKGGGTYDQQGWDQLRIIYASRTHSQLSQAMQELKRTDYKHVRATILGSRDQMCIDKDVSKEQNSSVKIHMCQAKVKSGECSYYNNVEKSKSNSEFYENIMDIEDLVKQGRKHRCCPYFLTRELKQSADIVFMPYNYLLDPKSRKSQGIDLKNNVILLDEAHNIEKICEEAASLQITSTDVAICMDEITTAMTDYVESSKEESNFTTENLNAVQKDFTAKDLYVLKQMFIQLEQAIDEIEIKDKVEGETMPGGYIFELLAKVGLNHENHNEVADKLDKIILYLTTTSTSPFSRKGNALQKFNDLLRIAFVSGQSLSRIKQCYKVHIQFEEQKKSYGKQDSWESKKVTTKHSDGKVISYWCFSPGFGMQQLVQSGVRSIILTSGTLSPLKPFISEIGINIGVTLENPHIVEGNQICVGVLSKGPDGQILNSSYNTRNDPLYIASLGRTILNFSNLIPYGLLVFFPSYPILNKCREDWQNSGLWAKIAIKKPIFVEPQSKQNLASIMNEFYEKIQNPEFRGAIFMAVCRGKVSEGLDFANNNGRAVLITGLPFPPLKDPRVVLKKRYLDENYAKNKNGVTGQYWYQLEAMRAVNQAIGRIIRHKDDYGAIILCDCRFENSSNKNQLSTWLRPHIKQFTDFGVVTKELRNFFGFLKKLHPELEVPVVKKAEISETTTVDLSGTRKREKVQNEPKKHSRPDETESLKMYLNSENVPSSVPSAKKEESKSLIDALKSTKSRPLFNFNSCKIGEKAAPIKRVPEKSADEITQSRKKKKLVRVPFNFDNSMPSCSKVNETEKKTGLTQIPTEEKKELGKNYITEVKKFLSEQNYQLFRKVILDYSKKKDYSNLIKILDEVFNGNANASYLFQGFETFVKKEHKSEYHDYMVQLGYK